METERDLMPRSTYVILSTVGLDTQQTDWRIRHPQSVTKPRTSRPLSPIRAFASRYSFIQQYLGAWVGSQRKRPHCAFLGLALSCGYPIRLDLFKSRKLQMLYTFLIAQRGQRLAQVRTRTISAIAQNETKAREQLQGLPLVFVRCTPTKGAAA